MMLKLAKVHTFVGIESYNCLIAIKGVIRLD